MRVHDIVQTAKGQYDFGRVVTQSPAMPEVLEMTRRASESERTYDPHPRRKRHRQKGTCQGDSLQQSTRTNAGDQSELRRSVRYFTRLCDVLNASGQETHAARIIGIHPTSLVRRLKTLQEVADGIIPISTMSLLCYKTIKIKGVGIAGI